jgi:hypothetical protein
MDELTKYGIKQNLALWIAYLRLGHITLEQATERTEAYYLGIQECLDKDELKEVLPIFCDTRTMLSQLGDTKNPIVLFPRTSESDEKIILQEVSKVKEELDKFIQLQARSL